MPVSSLVVERETSIRYRECRFNVDGQTKRGPNMAIKKKTGGHLGQTVTKAFEGSGLMAKLKAKWGVTSLKVRSISAAAANELDFTINGFHTVVNALTLNQEITDANILALSSSVSVMRCSDRRHTDISNQR